MPVTLAIDLPPREATTRMRAPVAIIQNARATSAPGIQPNAVSPEVDTRGLGGVATAASSAPVRYSHAVPPQWTATAERDFLSLVGRKAAGVISPSERERLEEMHVARRAAICHRTAEDIAFEYSRRKVMRNLEKALREAIIFFEPSR